MKPSRPPKFTVANAEVDKARAQLAKRVSSMFRPQPRLTEPLPEQTQKCSGCGYWVWMPCSTCGQKNEQS